MQWKVIAASACGTSHAERDQPCQDAHDFFTAEGWLIGVACDGAGTAKFAEYGAAHCAKTVTNRLSAAIEGSRGEIAVDDASLRRAVAEAIEQARDTVLEAVGDTTAKLTDCNATVVGCVAGPGGGVFFQIGDGAGVALDSSELRVLAMSSPENGEFAEQTFFYTLDTWKEHLRFTPIPPEADLLALMSDGAMTFCLSKGQTDVEHRFFAPVTRYLSADDVAPETARLALLATLSSPASCLVTSDDKTLLWAKRSAERRSLTSAEQPASAVDSAART